MPEIIILGGPNGAGKTTAARFLFQERIGTREFVNADEIARGLSPYNPAKAEIAAGRLMLERMNELHRQGESFVVETTCAGQSNLNFVRRCKAEGWQIGLLYLWLRSPQAAIRRVARRVQEGGHDVPPDVVKRRYWSGLINVRRFYLPLADFAMISDNTDGERAVIAEKIEGGSLVVHDERRWSRFREISK
jgi:predicted ABC-type ATPase